MTNYPTLYSRTIQITATMGGGRWFYFPTHIWTPSGGWFASPKNWKANTLVVLGGIGLAAFSTFSLSASLEVSECAVHGEGGGGMGGIGGVGRVGVLVREIGACPPSLHAGRERGKTR